MVTANRIHQVALAHFAEYGYDGASMAKIAEEVGIKKPSIYAHYKSKEDLFLHVLQGVFQEELDYVGALLRRNEQTALHDQLKQVLTLYKESYAKKPELKFMLRMSFFPPASLHEQVMGQLYAFLDRLESGLVPLMAQGIRTREIGAVHPEQAATAFMCILDGLFVELLYGGPERFERKLEASWALFWRGLTCESNGGIQREQQQ
ncbi:TetR/AcrR family transcriptional regulator [Paenibacillus sp. UMB4589-SE434]|uniref:TetR/AcrR family transcriptional regulator n=1 Tax=Paenibacillus sp. UMB4589-SE434 TaxID=3046314 RepID=UPI00254A0DEA|nr:TetR/AcrR family transcriptional regulator [Paenibacillus sp. UMB4589-SE434]MDK8181544.1 TetR/AcrR family transcriptional regulator [Paenibacillus sp. UMB4589-SE434]